MFGRERLIERRCNECGMAWLLTHAQAKFAPHRSLGPYMAQPKNMPQAMAQMEARSQALNQDRADVSAEYDIQHQLRACPKCQSENFTDRKVTKEQPASPNASRNALP